MRAARSSSSSARRSGDRAGAQRDGRHRRASGRGAGLTDARQRDYAIARGLLKLPGLDAPDIGAALFGSAAVDRFQRACTGCSSVGATCRPVSSRARRPD